MYKFLYVEVERNTNDFLPHLFLLPTCSYSYRAIGKIRDEKCFQGRLPPRGCKYLDNVGARRLVIARTVEAKISSHVYAEAEFKMKRKGDFFFLSY